MTMDEAFAKWAKNHELYDLPWQIDQKVLRGAFEAGWAAHAEAGKQTLIPTDDAVNTITPEDIYKAYPRKVGKGAAIKAITKAISKPMGVPLVNGRSQWAQYMLNTVKVYADAVAKWPAEDRKYVPHAATWFNQERYLDDPKEWRRGADAMPSQFSKRY